MAEHVLPKRRRGRPRAGGTDTRSRIVEAAAHEFAATGYDGATMRAIAARAGVDAALVHHYFGTKADLFATVIDVPMRPDMDIPGILAGPRDQLGERLVRYILDLWDRPDVRRRGLVVLRTAIGNKAATPLLAGFLSRELLGKLAAATDAADPAEGEFRAALVGTQIAGILMARYVLQLRAMVDASPDAIVEMVAPTIQRYLFGT